MRILLVVIAGMILVTSTASGHHSPAGFILDSRITIQGTVSRLDWRNPHVYIYIDARNGAGEKREWMIETDPVPILTRNGWRVDSIAVGDVVMVRANPDRNTQRNHALLISIALESGVVLTPRSSGVAVASRASSLVGVWDTMRGFNQRRLADLTSDGATATEKGRASQLAYSLTDNPAAECVPFPSPFLPILPYLNEIELREDTVIIRSEFFNVDRTVYMDGREHPENGARTNQGHSIGRWEGGVLVVDTTHFEDHLIGNNPLLVNPQGIPSGAQKHVVERYQLSEDGTRLLIDLFVEDPEYLAEPFTATMEWDYAPALEFMPFGCDPEDARRFTFQ
jgi:hypothetical protein